MSIAHDDINEMVLAFGDEERAIKAQELDNAILLDIIREPRTTAAQKKLDECVKGLMKDLDFEGHRPVILKNLKVVVLELLRAYRMGTGKYVAYHRGREGYMGLSSVDNPNDVTFKLVDVVDTLIDAELLDHKMGFYDRKTKEGKLSRMRATQKLVVKYFKPNEVLGLRSQRHKDLDLLVLKGSDKKKIPYEDTKATRSMKAFLKRYNALLDKTDISLPAPYDNGLDTDYKQIYRVFRNGSFKSHGRFYGGFWQSVPSKARPYILINGNPTVELDYGAQTIHMLYGLAGRSYMQEVGDDPYQLDGRDRADVKRAVLIVFNSDASKAKRAFLQRLKEDNKKLTKEKQPTHSAKTHPDKYDFDGIVDDFIKKHPDLKGYLYGSRANELMYLDSKVAEQVLKVMTSNKIPCLSIHDSFIVESNHKDTLKKAMEESYEEVGIPLMVAPVK